MQCGPAHRGAKHCAAGDPKQIHLKAREEVETCSGTKLCDGRRDHRRSPQPQGADSIPSSAWGRGDRKQSYQPEGSYRQRLWKTFLLVQRQPPSRRCVVGHGLVPPAEQKGRLFLAKWQAPVAPAERKGRLFLAKWQAPVVGHGPASPAEQKGKLFLAK